MKLYDNQWIYGNVNNFSREHEDYTTIINHQVLVGAAEPLDKNGLRIVQPTLGFLSAIGGKYGNYERGYPQVLQWVRS